MQLDLCLSLCLRDGDEFPLHMHLLARIVLATVLKSLGTQTSPRTGDVLGFESSRGISPPTVNGFSSHLTHAHHRSVVVTELASSKLYQMKIENVDEVEEISRTDILLDTLNRDGTPHIQANYTPLGEADGDRC